MRYIIKRLYCDQYTLIDNSTYNTRQKHNVLLQQTDHRLKGHTEFTRGHRHKKRTNLLLGHKLKQGFVKQGHKHGVRCRHIMRFRNSTIDL